MELIPIITTSSIILFAAVIGSSSRFLAHKYNPIQTNEAPWSLFFMASLVGSGVVPLFLQMISSDLITAAPADYSKYFVLLGFCLIASVYSTRFVDTIADKLLKQVQEIEDKTKRIGQETEENTKKIDTVIENDSDLEELEISSSQSTADEEFCLEDTLYDIEILNILNDRSNGFKYRTVTGIKKSMESKLKNEISIQIIKQTLSILSDSNYVFTISRKDGNILYGITKTGKRFLNRDV